MPAHKCAHVHMHTSIGITWLMNTGGAKSTMGIRDFNIRNSHIRKRGKTGLNQSLIYMPPFPPLSANYFYFPLFNSVAKKLFLGVKNIGGSHLPHPPKFTPAQTTTNASMFSFTLVYDKINKRQFMKTKQLIMKSYMTYILLPRSAGFF